MKKIELRSDSDMDHWQAWQSSRQASKERENTWGRQVYGAKYHFYQRLGQHAPVVTTQQQYNQRLLSEAPTMLISAIPATINNPISETGIKTHQTDEYDLRVVALPQTLDRLVAESNRHHHALPEAITLHPCSALVLAAEGIILEGCFRGLIPVLLDSTIAEYSIRVDHHFRTAS